MYFCKYDLVLSINQFFFLAISQQPNQLIQLEDILQSNLQSIDNSKNLILHHRSRRDLFDFFGGLVSGVVNVTGNVVGGVADTVGGIVTGVANATGDFVSGFVNATGNVISGAANATGDFVSGVVNATGNVISGVANATGDVVSGVVNATGNAVQGGGNLIGNIFDGVTGIISGGVGLIIGTVTLPELIAQILKLLSIGLLVVEIVFNVFYALGYLFAGNILAVIVYVVNIVAGLLTFPL